SSRRLQVAQTALSRACKPWAGSARGSVREAARDLEMGFVIHEGSMRPADSVSPSGRGRETRLTAGPTTAGPGLNQPQIGAAPILPVDLNQRGRRPARQYESP